MSLITIGSYGRLEN